MDTYEYSHPSPLTLNPLIKEDRLFKRIEYDEKFKKPHFASWNEVFTSKQNGSTTDMEILKKGAFVYDDVQIMKTVLCNQLDNQDSKYFCYFTPYTHFDHAYVKSGMETEIVFSDNDKKEYRLICSMMN